MNIDIYKLMSKDKVETLRTTGLNKVAAALETTITGRELPENEMFLHSAIQILGEKVYEKRAAYKQIAKGIAAYRAITGG